MVSGWSPKSIAQLVGWGLLAFAFVMLFGAFVGDGAGASHEPGSNTIRSLMFEKNVGRVALGLAAGGVLALIASAFLRGSDDELR